MLDKLNFVFVGRLEVEKGFDLVNELTSESLKKGLAHSFFIFGKGSLQPFFTEDLSDLSDERLLELKPKGGAVYYCGVRDMDRVILPFLKKHVHYALMPSRVLESFGLAALEALAAGVPILGPQKGGLAAFIQDEHAVNDLSVGSFLERMESLAVPGNELQKLLKKKASMYSQKEWLSCVEGMLPKGAKKILLVSDFLERIGGAEQHMHWVADSLRAKGYQVELFGRKEDLRRRVLGLLVAVWNPFYAKKLKNKLQSFQADLIWCHSVLRWLGPSSLRVLNRLETPLWITHHDFGLFVARPSSLKEESELPMKLTWRAFTDSPLALFKYFFLIKPLVRLLKSAKHLVPSKYMQPIVQRLTGAEVTVLPHSLR